jgi:hypothetical protein
MATTNDITGAEIKSGIYTSKGRDNYERIFAKKTAAEWLAFLPEYEGLIIMDPDGWRHADGVTLESKISYSEFAQRLQESTVMGYLNTTISNHKV